MLNAHLDTVGGGEMAHPFTPRRTGNRLYGRGAYDMKGSLAAIMQVGAEAVRRDLRGDVIVTAVADEEYASVGTQAIVARHRADAAIVTEPTALDLCVAHKGFVWIEIETRGRAAHGSRPDLGIDAIAKMGPVLVGLEALDQRLRATPTHRYLGSGSVHASLIEGGRELSTYPDRCRLGVERRTIPGETIAVVEAELLALLDDAAANDSDFTASLSTTLIRPPFEVASDEPIVVALRRAAETVLGREPALTGQTPWMDSALLSDAGIPTVVFGPGGEGAHAAVEWVDLDQVAACVAVLLTTVDAFCG
jgi:acetylornithine deacetylase